MSCASFRLSSFFQNSLLCLMKYDKVYHHVIRNASKSSTSAVPGVSSLGGKVGKISGTSVNVKISVLPVEENVERLQTHLCGSNLLKEGGEDVELKPDSEYPEWLWKLNLGPRKHYSKLNPDEMEYWMVVKRIHMRQQARIKARKRF